MNLPGKTDRLHRCRVHDNSVYLSVDLSTYRYVRIYIYMYIHTYTHLYIHVHVYVYTYVCKNFQSVLEPRNLSRADPFIHMSHQSLVRPNEPNSL